MDYCCEVGELVVFVKLLDGFNGFCLFCVVENFLINCVLVMMFEIGLLIDILVDVF